MLFSPIGLPTGNGPWTLTIRADGQMTIAGVDLHGKQGLRIDKLAKNGATSTDWASIDRDHFVSGLKALSPTRYIIFLGTNDQWLGGQVSVSVNRFGANLETIINRIREATPKADILIVSPPMVRAEGLPRALYAEQARTIAARAKISQLDLQCAFGSNLADYGFGSRSPLLDKTLIHPSIPGGRDAILTGLGLAILFD
jgi:lysophospholipase L1-like esterase